MNQFTQETAVELLHGAYDLHIHPKPSHFPRLLDDFALVEQAAAAGMAGVMLKSHYEPTGARAAMVNLRLGHLGTTAYGGIVLNWPAGGLNPYAAESALKMGARFVWMPTRDAANSLAEGGNMPGDFFSRPGISILDERGKLLPAVYEIMEVVKKYGGVLATGHISPRESVLLCRAGRAFGIKMVLTHPEFDRTLIDSDTQKDLASLGVAVEKCWFNLAVGTVTPQEMAAHIRSCGPENCFLTTDRGQAGQEPPAVAMERFLQTLLDEGFSQEELRTMVSRVPAQLVRS